MIRTCPTLTFLTPTSNRSIARYPMTRGEAKAPTAAKTARVYCDLDTLSEGSHKLFEEHSMYIGLEISVDGDLDDYEITSFEIKGLELIISKGVRYSSPSFSEEFKTSSEAKADHDGKALTLAASILENKVCGAHQSQTASLTV